MWATGEPGAAQYHRRHLELDRTRGFTSTVARDRRCLLPSASNVYTVTYTNTSGVTSSPGIHCHGEPHSARALHPGERRIMACKQPVLRFNVGDTANLAGLQQKRRHVELDRTRRVYIYLARDRFCAPRIGHECLQPDLHQRGRSGQLSAGLHDYRQLGERFEPPVAYRGTHEYVPSAVRSIRSQEMAAVSTPGATQDPVVTPLAPNG